MRQKAVKILGISISQSSKKEILEEMQKYLSKTPNKRLKSRLIFTPNTEQLVFAQKDPDFAELLNRADIALPDTIGVVLASKILAKNGIEKPIPGVEFMEDLVRLASDHRAVIGLIGGRSNLAVDTLDCLRQKYPELQDSWAEDGPEVTVENGALQLADDKFYFAKLGRRIIREETRVIFVALGPPKQEYFIERLARLVPGVIFMSVGGSFDIISGRLRRAPQFMRNIGLEWLWRLILEPWRLRRQLALVEFMWLVLREKLSVRSK